MPYQASSFWTDERVEQLKQLKLANLTASGIAAKMGISRNAALGKLYRLGLCQKGVAGKPRKDSHAKRARKPAGPRPAVTFFKRSIQARPEPVRPPTLPRPECLRRTIITVRAAECRFPSEEEGGQHLFCGQPTIDGPYCCYHSAIVYAPAVQRQTRKAA